MHMDKTGIALEVLDAVGGKDNVTASDICMTRLRIMTEHPSLVDTEKLSSTRGVLGIVRRGKKGIEVVFSPGKAEDVYGEIVRLTGIEPDEGVFDGIAADGSALQVQINSSHEAKAQAESDDEEDSPSEELGEKPDADDMRGLVSLLESDLLSEGDSDDEEEDEDADDDDMDDDGARVLVLNGPNINMLGIREPSIYGRQDYQTLLSLCHDAADEAGFSDCTCLQSNHEGDLVDYIQDALGSYDGIVINPGAYTHTSVAILDAVRAVSLPCVEIHISNVDEREDFRKVSYIRQACFETVTGMGIEGYRKAILDLAEHLGIHA